LLLFLNMDPDWVRVYEDESAVVHLRMTRDVKHDKDQISPLLQ
jgi:hypothetical protein